jgi:hypothetical protein
MIPMKGDLMAYINLKRNVSGPDGLFRPRKWGWVDCMDEGRRYRFRTVWWGIDAEETC